MLSYFPAAESEDGLLGVSYLFEAGQTAMSLRLPVMMAQIRMILTGGARYVTEDGMRWPMPRVMVVGPANGVSSLEVDGGTRIVGVGVTPLGWHSLMGAPAESLSDQVLEAGAVLGDRFVSTLLATLRGADGFAAAAMFGSACLSALPARRLTQRSRLKHIGSWLEQAGTNTLDGLAEELNLSCRQTARLTASAFGCTPKLMQMKYRALRHAVAIGLDPVDRIEDASLYYDQSHLIRDFKRFVGCTPEVFRRDYAAFNRTMLRGRWQAGARSAVTLWS